MSSLSISCRVLICCTCHFQSGSLFFVYSGFLCKYLQCPISALTQGGKDDQLFRLTCSVVLWGGRDTANKYRGVCGECSQCMDHTGFAPVQGSVCFLGLHCSGSRVLCRALSKADPAFHGLPRSKLLRFRFSGILQGHTQSVGHVFCALPRSEQLRQPGVWQAHCPMWAVCLNHLPSPAARFPWVCRESAGVSCVSSRELISGCSLPGRCQPSRIPGRCG